MGEIQGRKFPRLADNQLATVRRTFLNAHHSNRIEGIILSAETRALFEVIMQERVPVQQWSGLVMGFTRK